jgi:hypothetical protein
MRKIVLANVVTMVLLGAGFALGVDQEPPLQRPPLSSEYAKLRDQVLPNPTERSYRKIGWRTSVLQGIVDSQKEDRPVMIVLMNGHPLGCT